MLQHKQLDFVQSLHKLNILDPCLVCTCIHHSISEDHHHDLMSVPILVFVPMLCYLMVSNNENLWSRIFTSVTLYYAVVSYTGPREAYLASGNLGHINSDGIYISSLVNLYR